MPDKKLSQEQIEEIKALKKQIETEGGKFVYSHIAKQYGVSVPTIRRNIEPNENDKKPRQPSIYNPIVGQRQREKARAYQFRCYKSEEDDKLIIEKLDSIKNKQQYIKKLILQDILSK